MAGIAVLLIILGCGAYQYLKGTIAKGVATIIVAVCASIVALSYFEWLAGFFLSKGSDSRFPALIPWAQTLCFVLLFIVTFALLQTVVMQLMRVPVDFGFLPERIGRVVCGILLGLVVSGLVLTAAGMSPLPNKYPYQRFDDRNPDPEKPNKVLLNVDGLVTGWFGMVSNGSFRALRNPRSFTVLHPDFLDQLYLNRHKSGDTTPFVTSPGSIEVPRKAGYWFAPDDLKDSDGQPIPTKTASRLMIVRVGIKKRALNDAGNFCLSQLRMICKQKGLSDNSLAGKAKNVYPIGYVSSPKTIQRRQLTDVVTIVNDDFDRGETQRWIDFVFHVPNDSTPALVQFKMNDIAELSSLASADQIPELVPFVQRSGDANPSQKPNESGSQPSRPNRANRDRPSSSGGTGLSPPSQMLVGPALDEDLQQ